MTMLSSGVDWLHRVVMFMSKLLMPTVTTPDYSLIKLMVMAGFRMTSVVRLAGSLISELSKVLVCPKCLEMMVGLVHPKRLQKSCRSFTAPIKHLQQIQKNYEECDG